MTTLMSHPSIARMPVLDCGEPLVEVDTGLGGRVFVRQGVDDRLVVARALLPEPYRLVVIEGYRSLARQMALELGYMARLRLRFPILDDAQIRVLASRAVAPVAVAPHVAGAAIDVTIIDTRGREVDMGSRSTPPRRSATCTVTPTPRTSHVPRARTGRCSVRPCPAPAS